MIAKNRTQRNEFILYFNCEHYVASLCPFIQLLFPFIVRERFERGIQDAVILESDEALVVVAQEEFDDVTQDGKRQLYVSPLIHQVVHVSANVSKVLT